MKKMFKLEGLDCANCAAKIEKRVSKLEGIKSVSVNFMTTKMTLDIEGDVEKILTEAKAIVKDVEPDVNIVKA
ncbi:MAG: heavy-metal-associated domain-containing protein [Fusobacterium sp.]|nr:heavy-metal-associated domain-containing protein [Fusobacterium sp.]